MGDSLPPYAFTWPRIFQGEKDGQEMCISDGSEEFWDLHGSDVTILWWDPDEVSES